MRRVEQGHGQVLAAELARLCRPVAKEQQPEGTLLSPRPHDSCAVGTPGEKVRFSKFTSRGFLEILVAIAAFDGQAGSFKHGPTYGFG